MRYLDIWICYDSLVLCFRSYISQLFPTTEVHGTSHLSSAGQVVWVELSELVKVCNCIMLNYRCEDFTSSHAVEYLNAAEVPPQTMVHVESPEPTQVLVTFGIAPPEPPRDNRKLPWVMCGPSGAHRSTLSVFSICKRHLLAGCACANMLLRWKRTRRCTRRLGWPRSPIQASPPASNPPRAPSVAPVPRNRV